MKITHIVLAALLAVALPAFAGIWETDFEDALQQARAEGKLILANFSGSDWCGWCIRLDREVFSESEFEDFADDHLVCVLVDFPRSGLSKKQEKQNRALMQEYGVRGFPTVLLLDADGNLLEQTGYRDGGVEPYIDHLEAMLEAHADKRTAPASEAMLEPEMRTWTSSSGDTMEAVFRKMDNVWVHLETEAGDVIKIHAFKLSSTDQQMIAEYRQAER